MPAHRPVNKWLLSLLLILVAALSATTFVDQRAAADYEQLFQRAFITFALARTLNGVISAVQGTEIALQPAGVGMTLTPGEILDPVNDLVERFSWIMLGATISLGIQNVLLDISAWWAIQALVTESQKHVCGEVRFKLYKGNVITAGRRSPLSLYNPDVATMEADPTNAYDQDDASGFIHLNGLRLKTGVKVHGT